MMFQKKSALEVSKMTPQEKLKYYHEWKEELIKQDDWLKYASIKNTIHPFMIFLVKMMRIIEGHKLEVYGNPVPQVDRPIIIAMTHICKWDLERVAEAIKIPFHILAGDPEYTIGVFPDDLFLRANGVFYFDSDDTNDRNITLQLMIQLLKEKKFNILWAPEGTWNISDNKLILNLWEGPVFASVLTDAYILPVALTQDGDKFSVNIGSLLSREPYVQNNKKLKQQVEEYNRDLRDALATLKMELILKQEVLKRDSLKEGWIEEERQKILDTWKDSNGNPIYTKEKIEARYVKEKKIPLQYQKAFGHLFK